MIPKGKQRSCDVISQLCFANFFDMSARLVPNIGFESSISPLFAISIFQATSRIILLSPLSDYLFEQERRYPVYFSFSPLIRQLFWFVRVWFYSSVFVCRIVGRADRKQKNVLKISYVRYGAHVYLTIASCFFVLT